MECRWCGRVVEEPPFGNTFCSRTCQTDMRNYQTLHEGEEPPDYMPRRNPGEGFTRDCEYCGERFATKIWNKRFCCEACRIKARDAHTAACRWQARQNRVKGIENVLEQRDKLFEQTGRYYSYGKMQARLMAEREKSSHGRIAGVPPGRSKREGVHTG